jgi:hypothetical protein
MALTKVTNDLQDALAAAQPTITSVGTLTNFTSTGIDDNATSTAITIDASENVGIGTNAPSSYGKFAIRGAETIGTFGEVSGHFSDAATGSMYITHASNNISLKTDGDLGLFANNADSVIISTTATERLRVDASGRVTMPSQPSFRVGATASFSGNGTIHLHPTSYHDVGNNYAPSNGRFTAPVAGVYYFGSQLISLHNSTTNEQNFVFTKNGAALCDVRCLGHGSSSAHLKTVVQLAVGDYIRVENGNGNTATYAAAIHNQFCGYLIG